MRALASGACDQMSAWDEQRHCVSLASGPLLCGVAEVPRPNGSRSQPGRVSWSRSSPRAQPAPSDGARREAIGKRPRICADEGPRSRRRDPSTTTKVGLRGSVASWPRVWLPDAWRSCQRISSLVAALVAEHKSAAHGGGLLRFVLRGTLVERCVSERCVEDARAWLGLAGRASRCPIVWLSVFG